MALVSPKQLCKLICTIGGKVGRPQLPGLPSRRQSYRFTLEPAEKRADSQVLVLGFSQAPSSTACMPQPLGPSPFLPCSLQYQH